MLTPQNAPRWIAGRPTIDSVSSERALKSKQFFWVETSRMTARSSSVQMLDISVFGGMAGFSLCVIAAHSGSVRVKAVPHMSSCPFC